MTQTELAVALGDRYSQSMISQVETGRSSLLLDGLVNAAKELNVSTDYLLGLTDDPNPASEGVRVGSATTLEDYAVDFVRIPREEEVPVPAQGSLTVAAPFGFAFSRVELEQGNIDPAYARIFQVQGQSMYPEFPDGSLILVDYQSAALRDNGIYAVRIDERLLVRRLRRDEQGGFAWHTDYWSARKAGAAYWFSPGWYWRTRYSGTWGKDKSDWEPIEHKPEFQIWGEVRGTARMLHRDG